MNDSREQKLVDCCFAFALMSREYMKDKSREEVAEWVRQNLAELDFHTRPIGSSWGVLYTPKLEITSHDTIVLYEPARPD